VSNIAIYKLVPDGRKWTCGFRVTDSQVLVVELNMANQDKVARTKKTGYLVEETKLPPGYYSLDDYHSGKAKPKKQEPEDPPRSPGGRGGAYSEPQESRAVPQVNLDEALS